MSACTLTTARSVWPSTASSSTWFSALTCCTGTPSTVPRCRSTTTSRSSATMVGAGVGAEPEPVALEGVAGVGGRQHRGDPRGHDPGHVGVGSRYVVAVEPGGVDRRVAELVTRPTSARRNPALVVSPRIAVSSSAATSARRAPSRGRGRGRRSCRASGRRRCSRPGRAPARGRPAPRRRSPIAPGWWPRPAGGSRRRSPRHRPGPRSRARSGVTSSWTNRSGAPVATRSCSSTRSRPSPRTRTVASVTGCSTWRRVFISRK